MGNASIGRSARHPALLHCRVVKQSRHCSLISQPPNRSSRWRSAVKPCPGRPAHGCTTDSFIVPDLGPSTVYREDGAAVTSPPGAALWGTGPRSRQRFGSGSSYW